MFNSYNYKDVLTRASLTIQIIDDTTLYKASIFSANGNIFNINDKSSQISLLVQKGIEDITDQFTDIVWSRFHYKTGQYEEDLEWGKQHYGKKTFILNRDDILEKANIQVAVYAQIDGVKTLVAADYISFTDVNDMQGSETPPTSPKHGDLWLDISVTPPRLMMWDDTLKKWIEVVMSGSDKRNLFRNSNFYKNNFDYWLKVGNPTLQIESLSGKKWARLLCNNVTATNNGISQSILASPKSNYSFQMICRTYTQSQFPNGDVLVFAYSINNNNQKTLLKEVVFDINNEIKNYNFSFSSLQDTERIEIIISNKLNQQCDIMLTNTKLEKSSIPNEWEIAIEDIQDALDNKVGNSPEEVFDSLTDGGKMQGVYIDVDENGNKNYYFNASYIKSGYIYGERIDAKNLLVKRKDGVDTLKIDENGNVSLKGNIQLEADGAFVDPATKEDIANTVDKLKIDNRNLVLDSDFYITTVTNKSLALANDFVSLWNKMIDEKGKIVISMEFTANNILGDTTSQYRRLGWEISVTNIDDTISYYGVWVFCNSTTPTTVELTRLSKVYDSANLKKIKSLRSGGSYNQGIASGTFKVGRPQLLISDKDFDWSKAPEDIDKEISNKLNNNSQEIWDKVTDEGVKQGLFSKDGKVYINGEYVNAKNLRVQDTSGNLTFGVDSNGNITIKPTTFSLTPSTTNQSTMVNLLNNNANSGNNTNGIYLSNGKIYINGENIKANSVSAQHMTIGDFTNYFTTPTNYTTSAKYPAYLMNSSTGQIFVTNEITNFSGGEKFLVTGYVYAPVTNGGDTNFNLEFCWRDENDALINATKIVKPVSPNTQITINDAITIPARPANAHHGDFKVYCGNNAYSLVFSQPCMRLMYNGSLIVDGSITAYELSANSITSDKIASNSISTKHLLIGDFNNYCPVNPDNCNQFGFKKIVDNTNGDWIQADEIKRDIPLGLNGKLEYSGNVAGTYRVSFTMSSTAKGALNQDGTNINYLTVGIGLFTINNDGSPGYYVAGSGAYTQADANGSIKKYSTTITLPENTKSFGLFLQHAGWTNFSGVTKIKDIVVNKMMSGSLIVDGAIDGKTITGAVIKSTNESFLLDDSGINVNNGKFKVDTSGNIITAGSVNIGNKFKIAIDGSATMDNITATNLTVNTGLFKGSINVNNKFSVDSSGNLSINGGIFNVNNAGAMSCSNASITGGSLTIGSNFSVTNTGVLTAKSGKIAGYTITGNQLVGSNVGMSGLNGEGVAFWAGSNTAASAPFRVTHAGNLTATGVNITGNINSGSNITGATITSSKTVNGANYSINLDGAKMTSSTENTSTIESVIMEGNSLTLSQSYKDTMTKGTKTNLTYSGLVVWDNEGFAPAVTLDAYGTLNNGNVATFDGNIFTKGRIRIPNSSSCIEAKDTSGTYRNLAYISGGDSSYFGKGLYDAGIGQTMICGNTLWLRSNDRIYFQIAGNTAAINTNSIEFIPISGNSYFRPTVTDVTRLGSASQLWNIVYSKGGVNTTSDRNSKENIKYIYKDNTCFSNEDMYKFMKNDYLLAQYNYIGDPIEDEKISAIAQDLLVNEDGTDNKLGQLIVNCQDAVEMNKEGETPKLSINQTQLLNVVIGALQRTMDKVEALEQEVANLRTT